MIMFLIRLEKKKISTNLFKLAPAMKYFSQTKNLTLSETDFY